ncbi:MAG: mannose-1-phosphate guanylyltransferase/mannose-6-phosphate isomerase [Deltaproteobacteria bacterium]|nr:mannose-1-phosphate guanylyltransferase/mannose-6-phosphate isomerase [Deltaproteobacteria bacterium]MDE0032140.1 mannose-1-phosphate guanylyltransferase/mannose-6-phosphate isomerase [Deltaproteobacteria bacterium]
MSHVLFPVILSGGAGTRLWPLSRELHPKQFIPLVEEHTLLQATARRLAALSELRAPIVVCNEAHRFMVAEQLEGIGVEPAAVLLEPQGRNTAPAIAAAALAALALGDEDPILLVLPADHVIGDENRFASAVRNAILEAAAGHLVTFGVTPAYAETGYGYIKAAGRTGVSDDGRKVERFVEKPDAGEAAGYLEEGGYYWNSGMFVFPASRYLDELGLHEPAVRDAVARAHRNAVEDVGFLRLEARSFSSSPAVSVDYAVMEHTSDAVMVPLEAGWSDIGSWAALADMAPGDEAGNVTRGDTILERVHDSYVRAGDRLVAAVGVSGLVIVDTADALLVARKDAVRDTGKVAAALRSAGREEHRVHRKVHRPWGAFHDVLVGSGFKVKHIVVRPSHALSLQSHEYRSEHWTVVRGTARVTRGEETFVLSENQSTYIPRRTKHRLANPDTVPLEVVEVQCGDYLEEDDIVRYEDAYGRTDPGEPEPSD